MPTITFTDVSFTWPDGTACLAPFSLSLDDGLHGVIGPNGTGKTTLARLVTGDLRPDTGTISVPEPLCALAQDLGVRPEATVADLLGITKTLDALDAIARGEVDSALFDTVGDDWGLEDHARSVLDRAGLGRIAETEAGLRRPIDTVSGGEAVQVALAGIEMHRPAALLLDEPTNNLDAAARRRLHELLDRERSRIPILVISHDRSLLDGCDSIIALTPSGPARPGSVGNTTPTGALVTMRPGGYSHWVEERAAAADRAEQRVRAAKSDHAREKRQRIAHEIKQSRDERRGKSFHASKREPKMVMNLRKRAAEESAGALRRTMQNREAHAAETLEQAELDAWVPDTVHIELPDTHVALGQRVLELELMGHPSEDPEAPPLASEIIHPIIQGPERWRLAGANGSGKTTLLRTVMADDPVNATHRVIARTDRVGYIAQTPTIPNTLTLLDAVRDANPGAEEQRLRDQLARLLFRGDKVFAAPRTLSGGERFRAAVAMTLLASPAPQLLLLDEPTNNLDMDTVDWLVDVMTGYQGALMVVTHDDGIAERLGLTQTLDLDLVARGVTPNGRLSENSPAP